MSLGKIFASIAVIDMSAKIGSLCFQYSKAVKDAKNDIGSAKRHYTDSSGPRILTANLGPLNVTIRLSSLCKSAV
jgi:hypothetical protein